MLNVFETKDWTQIKEYTN